MKRFLTLLAAVGALLFSATSCDSDDAVAVTGIELDAATLSLVRGTSHKLTATLSPADAEDQTLKWESADPTVATVEAGVVTGVKVGETTVRVIAVNGFAAACKVTVLPVEVASVTLDRQTLSMTVGDSETLTATVLPADAEDPAVKWETSDDKVATVENGLVKAVGAGEAVVTASAGGQSAFCTVTVEAPAPATYAVGDLYDVDGVKGVVCWVDESGTSGKIVSMDKGAGQVWCADGAFEVGASDRLDGKANTAKIMSMGKPAGTFPACEWCVAKGEGWYLPAIEEVLLLFENFDLIDPALQANGGDRIQPEMPCWSSTEDPEDPAFAALFADSLGEDTFDKDDDYELVRAMYAFGTK